MTERTELEQLTDNLLAFFPIDWIYDRSSFSDEEKPLAKAVRGLVAKIFRLGMEAGYTKAMSDKEDFEPRYRVEMSAADWRLMGNAVTRGMDSIAGPHLLAILGDAERINDGD